MKLKTSSLTFTYKVRQDNNSLKIYITYIIEVFIATRIIKENITFSYIIAVSFLRNKNHLTLSSSLHAD